MPDLSKPLLVENAAESAAANIIEPQKPYRNQFAKKAFFSIWEPTGKILNLEFDHDRASPLDDDYENGYARSGAQISGSPAYQECEACCADLCCCVSKAGVGIVGGFFASLAGCGGFFVGAAKDACSNSEEKNPANAPSVSGMK